MIPVITDTSPDAITCTCTEPEYMLAAVAPRTLQPWPDDALRYVAACAHCGGLMPASTHTEARPMAEPTFDAGGYPTEETLDAIESWDHGDYPGFIAFCRAAWSMSYGVIRESQKRVVFITGGWSGNESVAGAMESNRMMFALHWYSAKRGGLSAWDRPKETTGKDSK